MLSHMCFHITYIKNELILQRAFPVIMKVPLISPEANPFQSIDH